MSLLSFISDPHNRYRLFKYGVYCLLAYNVYLFFLEDMGAAAQTFSSGVDWANLVEAYSATFDTAAWVVLLLLFELETAVLSDERLRGGLKWVLLAIRTILYAFITWALWGYIVKLGVVSNLVPFVINDVCSLVGSSFTYVLDLDEYAPVSESACTSLQGQSLFQIAGTQIIGTAEATRAAIDLAIVDVINATDWILIVILLEVEVLLQLWDRLSDGIIRLFKWIKGVLYSVLFACAAYWGFLGDFLDFWDAFLWLVAFIFIEMNIFQWHSEVEEIKESEARQKANSDESDL